MKTPTTLIIMDGYGLGPSGPGNAVQNAKTPNLDAIFESSARCTLSASGLDVGLPAGQIGNSEVGHTNIGAGRVVYQDLPRITAAIEDGSFFENSAFLAAAEACRASGGALHLIGLLSDGGVHSHNTHLYAFLELARRQDLARVYIHAFLDGRDVSPASGEGFVRACQETCRELGVGRIATVMGRYYAMDRDKRWERLERAYAAMVYGQASPAGDPAQAVADSYAAGVTDEFMEPVLCDGEGLIKPGDSVICINFRPDRAREITRALVDPDFDGFERKNGCFPLHYVCTTEYDATMPGVSIAFPPKKLDHIFGQYISRLGLTQLRIAETEKYAHVTFFFNGGEESPFPGEDRVLIPSPRVPTYDSKPEMSAYEVTAEAEARIKSGQHDVIILNLANCDMVGHTGVYEAAIQAVEAVDACVGQLVRATAEMGGICVITADHGNAEQMLADDGVSPMTAHTTNLVPFAITGTNCRLRNGRLSDIAPTLLDLLGLEKPPEMDGSSLIVKT